MIRFFLFVLLSLGSPAVSAGEFRHFNSWTKSEKIEFVSYSTLTIIDYRQTTWALDQNDQYGKPIYYEQNPIFGQYPDKKELMLAQMASIGLYYYFIGDGYSPVMRGTVFGIRLAAVIHNDGIGARIYKVF